MTTLIQSSSSILNTQFTGPDGRIIYEVSTPHKIFGDHITTITRDNAPIGSIEWHSFSSDRLSFEGREGSTKDLFPKTGTFSSSRVYTTRSGRSFQWKSGRKPYCVSLDSHTNLATCERVRLAPFHCKKNTLCIDGAGLEIADALVVTWVIIEKIAADGRQAAAASASSSSSAAAASVATC